LTGEQIATQEATFAQRVAEIKAELAENADANFEDASEVANGRIGLLELKQAISNFDGTSTERIQSYSTDEGITYILDIADKKSLTEKKYAFLKIENVQKEAFEDALKSKTTYTIEEVFVQDQLSWITAQTPEGKILNGANFKYASVSNSQIGQPVVVLNFDEVGKEIFCRITENNIGKQMAIFIGGSIITAPTIQAKICDGSAQID
jgi:preprotein translocase subunit SecD